MANGRRRYRVCEAPVRPALLEGHLSKAAFLSDGITLSHICPELSAFTASSFSAKVSEILEVVAEQLYATDSENVDIAINYAFRSEVEYEDTELRGPLCQVRCFKEMKRRGHCLHRDLMATYGTGGQAQLPHRARFRQTSLGSAPQLRLGRRVCWGATTTRTRSVATLVLGLRVQQPSVWCTSQPD